MSKPKTRRLPDTYNSEVTSAVPPRGSKSIVNPEQFEFLGVDEIEELRPTGDPKKSHRLEEMRFLGDVARFMT